VTLLAASCVDVATMRLPDALTAIVAAASAVLAWLGGRLAEGAVCAIAALVLLLVLRTVLAGRAGRQALGLGDVKLTGGLALWLGAATPWFLVLAASGALVVMLMRRPVDGRLAFGPSLAFSAWVVGLASEAGLWPI
jgi:leader peptidase (prepilin peptidase)/N-methyltransferase